MFVIRVHGEDKVRAGKWPCRRDGLQIVVKLQNSFAVVYCLTNKKEHSIKPSRLGEINVENKRTSRNYYSTLLIIVFSGLETRRVRRITMMWNDFTPWGFSFPLILS